MKYVERMWKIGKWYIFATFFPYQIAFGLTIRWLQCSTGFRLYFLFFKLAMSRERRPNN